MTPKPSSGLIQDTWVQKQVRAKTLKFCSRHVNSKISVEIYAYVVMYTEHRKRLSQREKYSHHCDVFFIFPYSPSKLKLSFSLLTKMRALCNSMKVLCNFNNLFLLLPYVPNKNLLNE